MSEAELRSTVVLNPAQIAVLRWIRGGCPSDVYPDDSYSHRISARALQSRGLVQISGHGARWRAWLTERGKTWSAAKAEVEEVRKRREHAKPHELGAHEPGPGPKVTMHAEPDARSGETVKAMRKISKPKPAKPRKIPVKQVSKQETYMKYKVVVTRDP